MEQYLAWRDGAGLPFDPWLRVHARLGATVVKVCRRSMAIKGTLEEWSRWTGMTFLENGTRIVPGALVPVNVDLPAGAVTYIEPNVWLHHRLTTESGGCHAP